MEKTVAFEIIKNKIAELCKTKGTPILVAIDGRCGSGKTTFAGELAKVFSCNVFHMDDFYLPMAERVENWDRIAGANMNFTRFREEILAPIKAKETVFYRAYICRDKVFAETQEMKPAAVNIVEGSYSQFPGLAKDYDLKVFLTCARDVQERRLRKREGDNFASFEQRWIPLEEQYFEKYDIMPNADLVVEMG